MRTSVVLAVMGALLASGVAAQVRQQAPTTIKKRISTPSGDAEMLFADQVSGTRAKLAGLCQKIGWAPRLGGSAMRLDCDVPSTETTTIALGHYHSTQEMVIGPDAGAYMDVPVHKQVTFWLSPSRGGTLVRARGERIYPSVNHNQPLHKPMGDENTFNGLINVMALVGGHFAPGTSFRRVGYIGFRSASVASRPLASGRVRTAIEVSDFEVPSPAAEAGVQEGDLVTSINERDFGDYEDAAKLMARLRPGDLVTLGIERAGKPMMISLTAGQAPAIR